MRCKMMQTNYVAAGGSPEQLTAFLAAERTKTGTIIKTGNIKLQQ